MTEMGEKKKEPVDKEEKKSKVTSFSSPRPLSVNPSSQNCVRNHRCHLGQLPPEDRGEGWRRSKEKLQFFLPFYFTQGAQSASLCKTKTNCPNPEDRLGSLALLEPRLVLPAGPPHLPRPQELGVTLSHSQTSEGSWGIPLGSRLHTRRNPPTPHTSAGPRQPGWGERRSTQIQPLC